MLSELAQWHRVCVMCVRIHKNYVLLKASKWRKHEVGIDWKDDSKIRIDFYSYTGKKGGALREDKGIKEEIEGGGVKKWKYTAGGLREGRSERRLIGWSGVASSKAEATFTHTCAKKGDERSLQHRELTGSHNVSVCAPNACCGNRTVVSRGCLSKEDC